MKETIRQQDEASDERDITGRKEAEAALSLSEQKFSLAFANNPAAIAMTRLEDGVFLEVNDAWVALNGYRRDEIIGVSARKLPIWPTTEAAARFVKELREKGSLRGWEQEFRKKSGETFVAQLSAQVLDVRDEKVILSTFVDITARKQAELALAQARVDAEFRATELKAILDIAPVAVWIAHDPQCQQITGNRYADELIMQVKRGANISASARPGDAAVTYKVVRDGVDLKPEELPAQRAATTGQPVEAEMLDLVFSDGRVAHMFMGAMPLFDANGRVRGSVAAGVDVTPLKRAQDDLIKSEATLRASEERFRALVETAPDAVIVEQDERFVFANSAALRLYGADSTSQLLGRRVMDLVHPDDRERIRRGGDATLKDGATSTLNDVRILRLDGQPTWTEGSSTPVNFDGRPAIQVIIHDITERKRIDDALRFLAQSDSSSAGETFFQALARYLAQSMGMDFVCIDRLQEGLLAAETVAVYFDGKFDDNVSYALKDTPCGDVVANKICRINEGVRRLFPKDEVLQQMSAESYVGTILPDSKGRPIGLIAVIGRQPLRQPELAESILRMVAVRAGGEMERQMAEDALRIANERLALAQQSARAGAWAWDMATGRLDWSPELFSLFGRDPSRTQATFDIWRDVMHPDDRQAAEDKVAAAARDHARLSNEYRIILPSGDIRWIGAVGETNYDESGKAIRMSGLCFDITERKHAEEEIRLHAEKLRLANEDLIRFNRVAVDRELRMIELKREVNTLCAKIGQPPAYKLEFEEKDTK